MVQLSTKLSLARRMIMLFYYTIKRFWWPLKCGCWLHNKLDESASLDQVDKTINRWSANEDRSAGGRTWVLLLAPSHARVLYKEQIYLLSVYRSVREMKFMFALLGELIAFLLFQICVCFLLVAAAKSLTNCNHNCRHIEEVSDYPNSR